MSDADAFEHYDDPANRGPASGPARRRRERTLTQHVPVRFPTATVDAVRELAEADGLSVSAWIRRTVDRALSEQNAPETNSLSPSDMDVLIERLQRDVADLQAALGRGNAGLPARS